MQRQQDGQPCQFTALMICLNAFEQFRQQLQAGQGNAVWQEVLSRRQGLQSDVID